MSILLSILVALVGLAAAWLECFDRTRRRPTLAGWIVIAAVVVLAMASAWERADLVERNEGLVAQIAAVGETLDTQGDQNDAIEAEIAALRNTLETQGGQTQGSSQDELARELGTIDGRLTENRRGIVSVSLEVGKYYSSSISLPLTTPSGGQERLLPCCDRTLYMNADTPFLIERPIRRDGTLHYLINFNTSNSNSDFPLGWQNRVLDPRQLRLGDVTERSYEDYERSAR